MNIASLVLVLRGASNPSVALCCERSSMAHRRAVVAWLAAATLLRVAVSLHSYSGELPRASWPCRQPCCVATALALWSAH